MKIQGLRRAKLSEMSSALPRQRAFLVQYASDADPGRGRHWGRIEHVESGQSQRFRSRQEFDDFVIAVLSEKRPDLEIEPIE